MKEFTSDQRPCVVHLTLFYIYHDDFSQPCLQYDIAVQVMLYFILLLIRSTTFFHRYGCAPWLNASQRVLAGEMHKYSLDFLNNLVRYYSSSMRFGIYALRAK